MNRFLSFLSVLVLSGALAACGGSHTHDGSEDHEHGDDTHTHEAAPADTAGTYVDSTGAFFNADSDSLHEAHEEEGDHEHGEETHSHDDDGHSH